MADGIGGVLHAGRRRIDLPCEALDLTPPPHRLDLMLINGAGRWTLLIHSPTGRLIEVERWLAGCGCDEVRSSGGIDPRVLRAEFTRIPGSWCILLEGVSARFLHLSEAGLATLFLEPEENLGRWVQIAKLSGTKPHVRHALAGPASSELTARQFEAVSLAVSMGYYEVPHRVNQRDLAKRLGMSLSGISRLLRRAEACIIRTHMDAAVDVAADAGRFRPLLAPEEAPEVREGLAPTAHAAR